MADDHGKDGKPHKKHKKHHADHPHEEHHEGCPEWMVSFADNVCLMMGFFVIMLAMNMKPAHGGSGEGPQDGNTSYTPPSALLDAAIAIREGFKNPVNMNSAAPEDQPLIRRLQERKGTGRASTTGQSGPTDSVTSVRTSDYYSLGGVVPFNDGAVELSGAGERAVAEIADKLKGPRFVIEVRGHVSAVEAAAGVDVAMSVSHRRALAVARGLNILGIPWSRMRVVACADGDRVTPIAYDEAGHRANQRVEVLVTRELEATDPFLRETAKPSTAGNPASAPVPVAPAGGH
ncbi:MAG: OmpA family protein [Phycisphaerales bacterium]|nr:OmpA family protein [Phycisphaerales bacterium]